MARDSVCKYKFTVEKHGRKWTQVVIQYASGKNGKAKVLKESVADVEAGQTVERNGKLDIQSTRYGTTVELILLSDSEVQDAKEAERQAFIDKWWGYFLDSYKKGDYYGKAVYELHSVGYFEKDKEIREKHYELMVKKWWGYFLDSYEKGWYYQRAVSELHALNYHDKDEEIKRCRQEIDKRKREEQEKRDREYAHFNFKAEGGFEGKPTKGEMFVKNNIPYEVVSSYYHDSDGFSFGVMSEDWYSVKAKDISDTDRGKKFLADYLEKERWNGERTAVKKEKQTAYKVLQNVLAKVENMYRGEEIGIDDIKGTDVFDSFDVYGYGEIVRVSDDKVWLIVNNGSDGAFWGNNNIRTGGAGAYGYMVDYEAVKDKVTAYLEAEKKYKTVEEDYHTYLKTRH